MSKYKNVYLYAQVNSIYLLVPQQVSTTGDVPCRYNGLLSILVQTLAFASVPEKLKEHYGITIALIPIQALTEKHANQMSRREKETQTILDKAGCRVQIGFITGSMIPIVNIDEEAIDSIKNKALAWK